MSTHGAGVTGELNKYQEFEDIFIIYDVTDPEIVSAMAYDTCKFVYYTKAIDINIMFYSCYTYCLIESC